MKLCDLSCLYYPHGGGIKTYIDGKRSVYKTRNTPHILIAPNVNNQKKTEKTVDGSLAIYYLPSFKVVFGGTPYFIFRSFKDIRDVINQEKPGVIEIGDKITTLLYKSKIKKLHQALPVKIFAFSHERADNFSQTVLNNKILSRLFARLFIRRFAGAADAIIANSDFTGEEILKFLPKDKVHVLKLGINTADFSREICYDRNLYQKLSENGQKTLLIHVGRLDKDKKTELLVQIARELDEKKYKLIVVGGGGYENEIKAMPAVEFIGYIPHEEVKKYLAVSQLGVLVNNIEPYGLVGLEMMALGLAVLGPHAGGLISFLKKDFAWLLPYDKYAYLEALTEWQNLPAEKKEEISRQARAAAENYTLEKMTDRLIEIYQDHE